MPVSARADAFANSEYALSRLRGGEQGRCCNMQHLHAEQHMPPWRYPAGGKSMTSSMQTGYCCLFPMVRPPHPLHNTQSNAVGSCDLAQQLPLRILLLDDGMQASVGTQPEAARECVHGRCAATNHARMHPAGVCL